MGIEIRPIPGQPGLFQLEGAIRWASAHTSGPRDKRRGSRQGLNGLSDVPFKPLTRPLDVGSTEGVRYTLYHVQPAGDLGGKLSEVFRALGYEVLDSSTGLIPISWKWEKTATVDDNDRPLAPLYFPVVTTPTLQGETFGFVVGYSVEGPNDPRKAQIEAALPKSVNVYRVTLKPSDEKGVPKARILEINKATRATRAGFSGSVAAMEIVGVPATERVAPTSTGAWWVVLFGVGAVTAFALQGRKAQKMSLADVRVLPPPVPAAAKCIAWRYEGGKRKCALYGSDTGFRTAKPGFKF